MDSFINILNLFLLLFYILSFTSYLLDFKNDLPFFKNSKRIFLFLTILIHLIFIVLLTNELKHFPITNKFEIFSLISFSIVFTYFLIELLTDIKGTGLFLLALSLILQVQSVFLFKMNPNVLPILKSIPMGLHVSTAILSYTAFSISAIYAILYFLLYKSIKSNKFGLYFNKLPDLEILEKLSFTAMSIGLVLLSIAIIIGIIWLPSAFPNFSYYDPKIISTFIVWIFYAVGISRKELGYLYGKKLIRFAIIGLFLIILASMGPSFFTNSFHTFG